MVTCMRLFISWSGGRSHRLAAVLKEWLEDHFKDQGISVFVSSEIKKGSLWLPAVTDELRRADAGLVCLTAQSLHSQWLLFEAGALSTAVARNTREARIFTYLLGVEPAALPGPLSVYQSTVATMEDTFRLVNSLLGRDQADARDFAPAWDKLWPKLQQIQNEQVTSIFPGLAGLFDRKTFQERAEECTDQSWFQRYDGAVATREALEAQQKLVAAECDAQVAELYRDLVAAVDGYAMDIRALLFEPRTFVLADDGYPGGPVRGAGRPEAAPGCRSPARGGAHRRGSAAHPAGCRAVRPVHGLRGQEEPRAPDRAETGRTRRRAPGPADRPVAAAADQRMGTRPHRRLPPREIRSRGSPPSAAASSTQDGTRGRRWRRPAGSWTSSGAPASPCSCRCTTACAGSGPWARTAMHSLPLT